MSAYTQYVWASLPRDRNREIPHLDYPGLTSERRVVLDLAFRGYGLSSEIVNKTGQLLAIADPAAKYDPLPGSIVARVELGEGLQRLHAVGARFDLIVCDIPEGATCAMAGAFAPAPKLAPAGVRRILGAPVAKAPAPRMELALAVWRATHALLTTRGGALLRMPVAAWEPIRDTDFSGNFLRGIHADRTGNRVDVYVNPGTRGRSDWTQGQRDIFTKTLLNK